MTDYTLFADHGTGAHKIYDIAKYLRKCAGGKVKVLGIGPSVGQNYGVRNGKGTTAVYLVNGVGLATPNDFEMACAPGGYYKYDKCIFVWSQQIANDQWMSDANIVKHKIPPEHDWNRASKYNIGGQTAAEWFPNAKYVDLVAGSSPQDIAQRICTGTFVTSGGNPSSPDSGSLKNYQPGYNGELSGNSSSNVSSLLEGEMTFEELIGEICKGVDLMFLCKRSTVVVTDFSTIFAEAQYLRENNYSSVSDEDLHLWQIEDDTYELNINNHGFYNTVYVQYKNGVVKEQFYDLVKVYGEVSIQYEDPTVDKTTAQMKAKSYLAAHLRDFELTVEASTLTEPNIDIGDIVTLNNPKSHSNDKKKENEMLPDYLFVKGINTNWEGDSYIQSDIELQFSPTSPSRKEVPTSGTYGTTNNIPNE